MKLIETYSKIMWRREADLIIEQIEKEELPQEKKITVNDLDNQTKEDVMKVTRNLPGKTGYQRWMFARLLKKELHTEDIYKFGEHEGREGFFQVFVKVKSMKKGPKSPNQFSFNDILSYKGHQGVAQFEKEAIDSYDNLRKIQGGGESEDKNNLITTSQIATLSEVGIEFLGMTEDGYQCFKIPKSLHIRALHFNHHALNGSIVRHVRGGKFGARAVGVGVTAAKVKQQP